MDLIGNTPILAMTEEDYDMPKGSKILAKLEYLNPGGSVKDRLGKYLIENGIKKGVLKKDTIIIEPTAGNTGIGVALAAGQYGIQTIFTVPEKFSLEKQTLAKALGAKIIHTPTALGMLGAIEKARELVKETPNSYTLAQFENFDNPASYLGTLSQELIDEVPEITSFVAGVGTGGTLAGVAKHLHAYDETIRFCAVEPVGSVLKGGEVGGHDIEGIGVEFYPPFLKEIDLAEIYTITDNEGFFYTRDLAKKKGALVGSSSGAAMAAALKEVNRLPAGSTVVTIFPDGSDRYLSKGIYDERL